MTTFVEIKFKEYFIGGGKMGLFNFISKQFLDIIEWEDSSSNTLVHKFYMQDNEIQNGGKLIVRPGQAAVFVNEGQIADVFGEGTYTLDTQNLPILGDLKGWAYGFKSPFKADVYFVSTKQFVDQKWGTPAPVLVPDPKFEQVELRAFGNFIFKVVDPRVLIGQVSSTDTDYEVDEINDQLIAFIVSSLVPAIVVKNITVAQLSGNYKLIDKEVVEEANKDFASLGLTIISFNIQNISLQEEYQKAMRTRSSVNIMGGMENYRQVETLDALKTAADNQGGGAGVFVGMGAGMGLGNMMGQTLTQPVQQPQPTQPNNAYPQTLGAYQNQSGSAIICSACKKELPQAAKFCGECGAKAEQVPQKQPKKNFCIECGNENIPNTNFCSKCGHKMV